MNLALWYEHIPIPTIWAGISFVFGAGLTAIAGVVAFRKYGPLQAKALEDLVRVYEKQIDAHVRALELQKSYYEEELRITREERDEYKLTLHGKREEWNAESVRLQLAIQELESRPNMSELNMTMKKVVKLIETVSSNLEKHDRSIDLRMKQFVKSIRGSK